MRDQSDLGLVGAQLELIKAVQSTGKPTIVVYVTGKPIAEPWVKDRKSRVCFITGITSHPRVDVDAIVHQFYPGEYGGM